MINIKSIFTLGFLFATTVSGAAIKSERQSTSVTPVDESELKSLCQDCDLDRQTFTIRSSQDDNDDVSDDFLEGIKQANNGGRLLLKQDETYIIGQKLNLTFLNDIEVRLDGEIKFTNDTNYWQENYFWYDFQRSITFWVWGGNDITIKGTGTLNGNGQAFYDGFSGLEILDDDNTYLRPILFVTDNATNVRVEGITQLNSPCWTNFFVRTKDVTFDNVYINAYSTNASSLPKNTDGFDSLNTDGITILNTRVDVGDDCFAPKPNTSNMFIQNLWCNRTHGVSMGSIGQYEGVMDYIEHGYFENVTMLNGENGARLKSWAGSEDIGFGYINNITFKDFIIQNTTSPILLDQCYFNINSSACEEFPSKVNMTNINFINFQGSSSGLEGEVVAEVVCSPNSVCENILIQDLNVSTPNGTSPVVVCEGIDSSIGVDCVPRNETSVEH